MVPKNENEDAPKRVLNDRVKALELIGTLMEREQKGVLWEHEFRQFIQKTVKHYNLTKPLTYLKHELEQRDQKWPEEAFAAPPRPLITKPLSAPPYSTWGFNQIFFGNSKNPAKSFLLKKLTR